MFFSDSSVIYISFPSGDSTSAQFIEAINVTIELAPSISASINDAEDLSVSMLVNPIAVTIQDQPEIVSDMQSAEGFSVTMEECS